MADLRYAALDVETTGLYPGGHDRVVEIGIVLFSLDGSRQGEYETLLNPGRDIGAQHIHGLSMADLVHAPAFEDVCGDLIDLLRDRVVVAHNATFDVRFLEFEFLRAGLMIPDVPHVCTMRTVASGNYGRRLSEVCARLGIDHHDSHTAIGDARAAADVLTHWYRALPSRSALSPADCGCPVLPMPDLWPDVSKRTGPLVRSEASRKAADDRGYLGRLLDSMPAVESAGSTGESVYLDLLERALEDRHLSRDESDQLMTVADLEGLGPETVRRLHQHFFDGLAEQAWDDGRLSRLEAADLRLVGEFLGIAKNRVAEAVQPAVPLHQEGIAPGDPDTSALHLAPGMSVCFTGALRATIYGQGVSREQAHRIATDAGLVVLENVTKKLDVLVVADPLTVSGKAKKAREYGTRVVAEAVFWGALGIDFE